MISMELLRKVDAFKEFTPYQMEKIRPFCEVVEYTQNDKLFTEGDPAEHFWTVVDGEVDLRFELPDGRVALKEQTISSVSASKKTHESRALGWSCFVPPYTMRLSAFCATPSCRLVRVAKKDLLRLFSEDPLMGYLFLTYLITVVGYRFHQFQDVVASRLGECLMWGW